MWAHPAFSSLDIGSLSSSINGPWREVDHCRPHSVEAKNEWSSAFTPSICFHSVHRNNCVLYFLLCLNDQVGWVRWPGPPPHVSQLTLAPIQVLPPLDPACCQVLQFQQTAHREAPRVLCGAEAHQLWHRRRRRRRRAVRHWKSPLGRLQHASWGGHQHTAVAHHRGRVCASSACRPSDTVQHIPRRLPSFVSFIGGWVTQCYFLL